MKRNIFEDLIGTLTHPHMLMLHTKHKMLWGWFMVVYDCFTHTTVEMEHDGKILEHDEPENLGKI